MTCKKGVRIQRYVRMDRLTKVVGLSYSDPMTGRVTTRWMVALKGDYVAMGVRLELSFLVAVSSASLTALIVRLLSSSISCAFAPNALP